MKSYDKNLLYDLKIDSDLIEYKVKNTLLRSCFRFFRINTSITLPINMITQSRSKKAVFGHFIEFTIKENSNRRDIQFKEKRIRKFWVMRRAPLKRLCPKMLISKTNRIQTCYKQSALDFTVINRNSVA